MIEPWISVAGPVSALGGIRWVLLALASGAVWLAAEAKRAADRLRR